MIKSMSLILFITLPLLVVSQNNQDEMAIRKIVDDMGAAWSRGDAEGFMEPFSDEHDFFVWNGLYFPGATKQQNIDNHRTIFEGRYKNTDYHGVLDKIRFIRDDVAVVMVMAAVTPKGEPAPEHPGVLWSATMHKMNGGWQIQSFHNADIEILKDEAMAQGIPFPIDNMYKSWYNTYSNN